MKKLISALLVLMMLLAGVSAMASSEWPARTIELVVPANPGGDTDANARALAAALTEEMGWNVVVSNMAGGAGAVAFEDVLSNPDDGYRFVFYHSGAAITQIMGMYESFNVLDDFKLAGMPVLDYSNAFVSNTANEKFSDVETMVAYMKANPGDVTFATETGSFTHLHVLAFQEAAGVEFHIVDAGTASQKTTELLGKRLDVIGTQAGLVRDYLDTKEFTCLGILADERLAGRPEIPTMKEQGYDIVFSKFFYLASINSYLIFYLMDQYGLDTQTAQYHLFYFLAAVAAGALLGGPIGDRIGRKRVIWVSILGVAPFTLALPHVGPTLSVALTMFIGFMLASAFPAILVYAQELFPTRIGTVSGLFFGLAFGLAGIGAGVLGQLADRWGIVAVYQLCAYLPLIGLLAVFLPDIRHPDEALVAPAATKA